MLNIILLMTAAIILFSLFYVAKQAAKPTEGIILGITLPAHAQDDPLVRELAARYNRTQLLCSTGLALLYLPLLLLRERTGALMILFLCWLALAMTAQSRVFTVFHDRLSALKHEKGWMMETTTRITIDTEVSMRKDTLPLAATWFIPPLLLSPLCLLVTRLTKAPTEIGILFGIITLFCVALFYLCYRIERRQPTKIISDDTAVNLAYNRIRQRSISQLWVHMAWTLSFGDLLIALSIREYDVNLPLLLFAVAGLSLSGILLAVRPFRLMRKERDRLAALSKAPVYRDEGDDAWRHGLLFYANPKNPRTWTESRIGGYGHALNFGSPKGKVIGIITAVLLAALVFGLSALMIYLDTEEIGMTVDADTFTASGPLYSDTFTADEIRSVSLITEFPKGMRTNGAADSRIAIGHFSLQGYGKAMLFVHKQNAPYIAVELEDRYVFVNGETPEQTQDYYDALLSRTLS